MENGINEREEMELGLARGRRAIFFEAVSMIVTAFAAVGATIPSRGSKDLLGGGLVLDRFVVTLGGGRCNCRHGRRGVRR